MGSSDRLSDNDMEGLRKYSLNESSPLSNSIIFKFLNVSLEELDKYEKGLSSIPKKTFVHELGSIIDRGKVLSEKKFGDALKEILDRRDLNDNISTTLETEDNEYVQITTADSIQQFAGILNEVMDNSIARGFLLDTLNDHVGNLPTWNNKSLYEFSYKLGSQINNDNLKDIVKVLNKSDESVLDTDQRLSELASLTLAHFSPNGILLDNLSELFSLQTFRGKLELFVKSNYLDNER